MVIEAEDVQKESKGRNAESSGGGDSQRLDISGDDLRVLSHGRDERHSAVWEVVQTNSG